jgi:Na+/H+ antiporter NhaD/arsenite permease-like protein
MDGDLPLPQGEKIRQEKRKKGKKFLWGCLAFVLLVAGAFAILPFQGRVLLGQGLAMAFCIAMAKAAFRQPRDYRLTFAWSFFGLSMMAIMAIHILGLIIGK